MFWAFSWIVIPVVGILYAAFREWLSFKEKQLQLGESTDNLQAKVEDLMQALASSEADKKALLDRIQNLETIVTSQVWDVIVEEEQPAHVKKLELDAVNPRLEPPPEEETPDEQARKIARRLRV